MTFEEYATRAVKEYNITDRQKIIDGYNKFSAPLNSNYAAHMSLNKGLASNATPEQRALIDNSLSEDDKEMLEAKNFYSIRDNKNYTNEEVEAQIEFEYGKDIKINRVNRLNKKAFYQQRNRDSLKAFGLNLKSIGQSSPSAVKDFVDFSKKYKIYPILNNLNLGVISAADFAIKQVEKKDPDYFNEMQAKANATAERASKLQAKYLLESDVGFVEAIQDNRWDIVGNRIGNALAFELPKLTAQIGLALMTKNPMVAVGFGGVTAAGQEYASMELAEDDLTKRVLQPFGVGVVNIVTEKLGTGKILDDLMKRQIGEGISKSIVKEGLKGIGRGGISESSATIGENAIAKAFGEEIGLLDNALLSGIVGSILDGSVAGLGTGFTQGDAVRIRKQNSNQQIDTIVEQSPLLNQNSETAQAATEAFKNPTEENIDNLNKVLFDDTQERNAVQEKLKQAEEETAQEVTPTEEVTPEITKIYHGTNKKFDEFGDQTIFFTSSRTLAEKGYEGAAGKGIVVERQFKEGDLKFADRALEEKYLKSQLEQMGYDGIKYDDGDADIVYEIWNHEKLSKPTEEVTPTPTEVNYNELSFKELRKLGNERNIKGRSKESIINKLKESDSIKPVEIVSPVKKEVPKEVSTEFKELTDNNFEEYNLQNPETKVVKSSRSKLANDIVTPLLSLVEEISPKLAVRLKKYEFDVSKRKAKAGEDLKLFLNEYQEIAKKGDFEYTKLSNALTNGDFKTAEKYLSKESISSVKKYLEKTADELQEVGFDFVQRSNYFPRRVKDLSLLYKKLGKQQTGVIQKALLDEQEKASEQGYTLSSMEESKIVNNILQGFYKTGTGAKPKNVKQRTIDEVTMDLDQAYYSAGESLSMYINDISDAIETRKLFGRDLDLTENGSAVKVNETVGNYINNLIKEENITDPKDQSKLIELFRIRFNVRPTGAITRVYKGGVNLLLLGQIQNAITQFGDMTYSIYFNGLKKTIEAIANKKDITTESLGITQIAEEFKETKDIFKVVNALFKRTGFRRVDQFGKETFLNSTIKSYQDQVKSGKLSKKKQDYLDITFDNKQQRNQVIEDLKNNKITDDIQFLAYSTLLDIQPITISSMPPAYIETPKLRAAYALKSFTITHLNIIRKEGVDDIVNGLSNLKQGGLAQAGIGASNLIKLATVFLLCNISTDIIKDLLSGKEIYLDDIAINNLWKFIGLSRYQAEYINKPSDQWASIIMPPIPYIDSGKKDIKTFEKFLKKGENFNPLELESVRYLPILGQTTYYLAGKGKEKEKKKVKQKRKEKLKSGEKLYF